MDERRLDLRLRPALSAGESRDRSVYWSQRARLVGVDLQPRLGACLFNVRLHDGTGGGNFEPEVVVIFVYVGSDDLPSIIQS